MTEEKRANALDTDHTLPPDQVRLSRSTRGLLQVQIGGQEYEDVRIRRAFPLDLPERFIGLFEPDGTEVGLLESAEGLDSQSRQVLDEELERTYFLPVITEVNTIGEEFGVVHAEVETTSGPRHIEIRGIRSHIRLLSRRRALIEDATGNRYELRDYHLLSKHVREILGL